jgi:Na+/H+ antiporter NhaD/arsenite permease-like protein
MTFLAAANVASVSPALVIPFGLLLALIAIMPLSPPKIKHGWDRYYPIVSLGLAGMVAAYYLKMIPGGGDELAHTLGDYVSFICLIGSLFVVAGGIHLKVKGESTPLANVVFLIVGAVVANVIGTTGASMVLIRPWIRMNKIRASGYHVVFFIFLIANIGGALTPVGDPPLFLGYLRGVPFFWLAEHVMLQWLATVGAVILVFYFIDRRSFARLPRRFQTTATQQPETWRFDGGINVLLLVVIVGAVFLRDVFFVREILMLSAAAASWFLTPKVVHVENRFSFGPIKEVAVLFAGIFATMLPALDFLAAHGRSFGFTNPLHYYFASGLLSSVLDNAPTYVNFLQLAQTTALAGATNLAASTQGAEPSSVALLLREQPLFVVGVSLGSVFFGAMTYIGNGPNFMVKSIAHDAGVHCPSFGGYIAKYSLPMLLPILAAIGWLFLS